MTPEIKQRIQQIRQGKTPKGYKKTKVGVIPSEWSVKQLKELGVLLSGSTPSRNNYKYWNGTVPWITTGELDNGLVSGSKERITELALNETGIKVFPKHTLLIAMYGQGKTRGTVAILNISAAVNQACAAITLTSDDYKYVYFKIQSLYNDLRRLSNTGNQENLNLDILKQYHLPLPPLPEQTAIAEILTTQDRIIELKEQLLAEKKRQKKYLMQQLLTGKMRLKGFKGEWRKCKLGEIVDIGSGRDYKHLSLGNIPVYGTGGYMLSVNEALSNDDAIGIGRKGTIDKPYILKAPFWTVDTLFYCVPKKNNDLYFVYSVFLIINWKEKDESTGVPSLSKVAIKNTQIFLPPLPEQTAIAEILSTVDREIELLQQSIEAEKLKKKSLMQLLLTGIVRVGGGMGSAFQAHGRSS